MNAAQEDGLWRAIGDLEGSVGSAEQQLVECRVSLVRINREMTWWRLFSVVLALVTLTHVLLRDDADRRYRTWNWDASCELVNVATREPP